MNLSPNFTLAELTRSDIALRKGLDNTPDDLAVKRLKALCTNILEPLREKFGAIRVNNGYRSPAVNEAIGGAKASQHMKGEAADIEAVDPKVTNADLAFWIAKELPFDQVILECYTPGDPRSGWVHVSYVPVGRREQLTFDGRRYMHGLFV